MNTFLIMAGGSGERLWPLSTKENPKQFLKIFNKKSLIQLTFERVLPLVDSIDQIFIATNELQVDNLKKEFPNINSSRIIIEPMFKDTAAAILYGSTIISKYYNNPNICVLASDHLIKDEFEFQKILKKGFEYVNKNNSIVTLGITPIYPETGYGYIKYVYTNNNEDIFDVEKFVEKPSLEKAKEYLDSKNYLWNSGIFIFNFITILSEFEIYSHNHYLTYLDINKSIEKNNGIETKNNIKKYFNKFEKISIDFAIMEKTKNIKVIKSSFGWNDVGNFSSFYDIFEKDGNGNIDFSDKNIFIDSNNNIVIGSNNIIQKMTFFGVNNMIVVISEKDILICAKEKTQDIKKIL